MKAVARSAFFLACLTLSIAWGAAASAQKPYTWSDIDCRQSRLASWPGLKCQTTNVVTTEGNVGAFRRWAAYGTTGEGYVHLFLSEAQNAFSYIPTEDTTADFLKWMYNAPTASQFSSVARLHNADYTSFRDGNYSCMGFRRTGHPRRGGYDWIMGGILCPPAGRTLTNDQFAQFIDRVRIQ